MINEKLEDLLKEQTKSYILCKKLGICDRLLRKYINEYNRQYPSRERLIVSDRNGYFLTTNQKLIRNYAFNLIRHALSELNGAKAILKHQEEKDNIKIIEEEENLLDIVMKLGELDGKPRL